MIKEQKIGDYYCKYFAIPMDGEFVQAERVDGVKRIITYPSFIGLTKNFKPTAKFRVKWKKHMS